MSEVLPERWNETRFSELLSERKERLPNDGRVPLFSLTIKDGISAKTARYEREFLVSDKGTKTYKVIYPNDLVFNPSNLRWGAIARSKVKYPVLASPIYEVVYPKSSDVIDPIYLDYIAHSDHMYLKYLHYMEGTLVERTALKIQHFMNLTLHLPPLPEQKKIASILTSVDEVIENTQKQIEKLQYLKKATMSELLTKGIGHTEFKDSELGRVPKSWEVKAISDIVSIPNGQVDPKIEPYASMPHIGSGNIISWTGQIKDVQTAFQAGQISGKYLFNANHILYSKVRPNLAKVCMPKFDGVCSADIYPLLPKEQISGKFIFQYLLTERFTRIASEVSERTGMPKINRQDLSVIKLPVPPFKEQLEIAKKIEAIDDAMSLKTKKLTHTKSLKKSLMQDLLTGKVRVQVN